jgi:hypothetical protein
VAPNYHKYSHLSAKVSLLPSYAHYIGSYK